MSTLSEVVIIDYGMGNLHSVAKAVEHATPKSKIHISNQLSIIQNADRIIFPGVGAMAACMHELQQLDLIHILQEAAKNKPFLGICLGLQALLEHSEENDGTQGLGIIPGNVKQFSKKMPAMDHTSYLKIPHMGWNQVYQECPHPLWTNISQHSRFYFVHSYYVTPQIPSMLAASSHYGHRFCVAIQHDNIFAVQFHPEKSQHAGLQFYANFMQWDGNNTLSSQ